MKKKDSLHGYIEGGVQTILSLSKIKIKVVFPELSNPRNKIFEDNFLTPIVTKISSNSFKIILLINQSKTEKKIKLCQNS